MTRPDEDRVAVISAITIECPDCSRRLRIDRDPTDPPNATLMSLQCDRCDDGDRHSPAFFDIDGWPVDPVAHLIPQDPQS